MSTIIATNLQLWRAKAKDGTITQDEMRQAIAAIRAERMGASTVSAAAKEKKATVKAAKAPIDSNALLDELF